MLNNRNLFIKNLLTVVAVLSATTVVFAADDGLGEIEPGKTRRGYGLAPSQVTIPNVPVGKEVKVPFDFEAHNFAKAPRKLKVQALTPKDSGINTWELGYDAVPDASWVKLEKTEFEAGPASVTKIPFTISIPDKPEYYNRKFMVAVVIEQAQDPTKTGAAIVLRLVSRLAIETLDKADVDGANVTGVALLPSIVRIPDTAAGAVATAEVKLRNNRETAVTLTPKRLAEVEADSEKHARYYTNDRIPVSQGSWLKALEPVTLQPGETKTVKLSVSVPADATKSKIHEELIFFADEKNNLVFVRLRTAVAP